MADMPVDYMGAVRMRKVLEEAGWESDHIRELRAFDRETLTDGLDRLADDADANDVALLYMAGQGRFLRDVVDWGEFFPAEWSQVPAGAAGDAEGDPPPAGADARGQLVFQRAELKRVIPHHLVLKKML